MSSSKSSNSASSKIKSPKSPVFRPRSIPEEGEDALTLDTAVADFVAIGSQAILDSPHVSEGPGRVASAPVPSVFHDDRGEIHRVRVGGQRINLTHSKPKVMRSGYIHPNRMHHTVISGQVELWILSEEGTEKTVYEEREYFCVPPYVPHILHFLKETVLVEWWDGDFKCWYYHPYRHVMNVQNSLVLPSETGTMMRLVPDTGITPGAAGEEEWTPIAVRFFWWGAGLAMGALAGALAFGVRSSTATRR